MPSGNHGSGSEKGGKKSGLVIVVDDAAGLDPESVQRIHHASEAGARVVGIGANADVERLASGICRAFAIPALDARSADDLLRRALPSLADSLRAHLIAKSARRPGALRSFVKRLGGRAFVSTDEIDAILAERHGTIPPPSLNRRDTLASVERSLDTGRFDEANHLLDTLGEGKAPEESVRVAIARARVAIGRGEGPEAARALDAVAGEAKGALSRPWGVARARASLRAGDYAGAQTHAARVVDAEATDVLACDALSVLGLAQVYNGDDARGLSTLERATAVATKLGAPRVAAVALCSLGIAHQKAGRSREARVTYETALTAAEEARDASTYATVRLNLASLAQFEGDLAAALSHLEAAVDMGKRTGALVAVRQALLNLASLDLYLGRFARAGASIEELARQRADLGPVARAQLLGLEAELATRSGDLARGAQLYENCAFAWEVQSRPLDAAESRLLALLARTREPGASVPLLSREFEAQRAKVGEAGFREHEALAGIIRGTLAMLAGDEAGARPALDAALEEAQKADRREWAWQALDARAKLASSQGNMVVAKRDTEAALAMLEGTAAKLPRDLREVFWDDPRRRALRQAHFATVPVQSLGPFPQQHAGAGTTNITTARGSATTLLGNSRPAEDRLARIFEITRELATEHDIVRLLAKVTDHAIALLGAERGFVVLVNDQGELETHAARDRKGDDPHASFSRSVAETVVRTGDPVIATSARDDARLAQAVSVHQLMIQSIACVPIRGTPPVGRTIGALYVETRVRPGSRFEGELPTLAAFADQAAIAIENARLVSENRARAEELALANADLAAAKEKLSDILGRRTEQLATVRRDLKQARAELRGHFGYAGLVGTSGPMRKLYGLIERIKDADVPLLITGESGTGKEVVARAVHAAGERAKKPFLGVNCGAIPANLLESELFGHIRGAFTGADRDRKGLFREAEGGTLLLDEIGDLPTKMQTALLRTLQEKTVRAVGGPKEEPVDTRVIAATNRDLTQMVTEGSFREDLFYRMNVIQLHVPPLRERTEDIPPLIDHFLTLFSARYRRERKAVDREALRLLCAYDWPGNVRQLEHVLLNAWLMSEKSEIIVDDLRLPEARALRSDVSSVRPRPSSPPRATNMAEFKDSERDRILSALSACNWNRVQAAKLIGVPRRTFYRRLKEYGIL
jgi:serine/threonine-protein kinase PknK